MQIKHFMASVRNSLCSVLETEDNGSLLHWIHNNTFNPDLPEDQMFVLPKVVFPESLQWDDNSRICVVFVLSTKALLRNAIYQQDSSMPNVQLSDGTFNLLGMLLLSRQTNCCYLEIWCMLMYCV
jgi:hypothetical protein